MKSSFCRLFQTKKVRGRWLNLEVSFVAASHSFQLFQSLLRPTLHQQPAWRLWDQPGNIFLNSFFFVLCQTHFHPARMGRMAKAAVKERSLQEGMTMATHGSVREARV